jgi:hypothetical protein
MTVLEYCCVHSVQKARAQPHGDAAVCAQPPGDAVDDDKFTAELSLVRRPLASVRSHMSPSNRNAWRRRARSAHIGVILRPIVSHMKGTHRTMYGSACRLADWMTTAAGHATLRRSPTSSGRGRCWSTPHRSPVSAFALPGWRVVSSAQRVQAWSTFPQGKGSNNQQILHNHA